MAAAAESHRWDHTVTLELAIGRHGFRGLAEGVTFLSRHPHAADWRKRHGLPVEASGENGKATYSDHDKTLLKTMVGRSRAKVTKIPRQVARQAKPGE